MLKELQYLLSGKDFNKQGDDKRKEIIELFRDAIPPGTYSTSHESLEAILNALHALSTILAFTYDGCQKVQLLTAKLEGKLEGALESQNISQEELMKLAALINYNRGVKNAFEGIKDLHQACVDGKLQEFLDEVNEAVAKEMEQDKQKQEVKFYTAGSAAIN